MSVRPRASLLMILVLGLCAAPPAPAQVLGDRLGLPVPVAPVGAGPAGGLVGGALGAVDRVQGVARSEVVGLRQRLARNLVREHRDQVDVDDAGQPVVRGRILALAPSSEGLAAARSLGFAVEADPSLDELGVATAILRPPAALDARRAIRALRRADPGGRYEYDHIYQPSGSPPARPVVAVAPGVGGAARIGLVDGAVAAHPSLAGAVAEQRAFASTGLKASDHATAVASLLVGQAPRFRSAAPGARLLVADVYGDTPAGGSALLIARGLAWLASRKVAVIDVSLVGPPNAVLEAAVRALVARGVVVVAAVGNDGPAAPPLFPASYPGVISVTAVDSRRRVLLEAGRRAHVDFAAPGADMAAASADGYVQVRGTSYAAPLVAGLLAARLSAPDPAAARQAVDQLARDAVDLGARGVDPVYGRGLVAFDLRTDPAAVKAVRRP